MQSTHIAEDETTTLLRDAARAFLQEEHSRERLRAISDNQHALDKSLWRRFGGQGWLGIRWPEALGGAGLGLDAACALVEQWGLHAVPEPLVACAALPGAVAAHLGIAANSGPWQTLADHSIGGERLVALSWQDSPQSLSTLPHAVPHHTSDGLTLRTVKHGVVAAAAAQELLVTTMLNGEPALWLLDSNTSGVSMRHFTTSDGGSVSTVIFDGVRLEEGQLMAQGAALAVALQRAVDEALLLTAAQLIGVAQAAESLTLGYLRTRTQFGKHIGSFQALQHAAVDVCIQITLARAAHQTAMQRYSAQPDALDTRAGIAAAKARASDAALLAGRFGVQAHGAMGFTAESDIGLFLKAALRLAAYLGNGRQQRERFGQLTRLHDTTR